MTYRVAIVRQAETDAQSIHDWLARRSSEGAARWFSAFMQAVDSLAQHPERCGEAAESPFRGKMLRQLVFHTPSGHPNRLLFTVLGDEVLVLHVRGPGQKLLGVEKQ
jgi:plasmid stabilization system protein ParE